MTTYGVTPAGFLAPTSDELTTDISDDIRTNVNPALDTSPDQPLGQVIGVFAQKLADVWQAEAAPYNAMNPDAADDVLLKNIAALTGTRPQTATYSTVTGTLMLNSSVTVPAGSVVAVNGQPQNQWVLVGPPGTPITTPAPVVSTTAGSYPGVFRSSQPGPFAANASTLTVIVTPVSGWTGITNAADAVPGLAADTDATLRQKREAELQGQGGGDVDAIRAALLKVVGVLQAFVYENTTLVTDGTGLPGKAFRAVIWDGVGLSATNSSIAQAIWNEKASGIQPFGGTIGTATDSQGNSQSVAFDRVTQVPIYVSCTTTPSILTTAQTNAVKEAIVAGLGPTTGSGTSITSVGIIGQPVVALGLRAAALVPGLITDVPVFQLGTSPSPVGTSNIAIGNLQIPTTAVPNILVNGV